MQVIVQFQISIYIYIFSIDLIYCPMTTKKTYNGIDIGTKTINLANSFDSDDDSIEIVVQQQIKKPTVNKNLLPSSINKKINQNTQQQLQHFKSIIDKRITSKSQITSKSSNNPIIIDSSLAPSLHTRAKGSVKMLNQFVPRSIDLEEKQFKAGRYEYGNQNNRQKQLKLSQKLKQTKLNVINLNDSQKLNNLPIKLDGPMYPWRRKFKPQPQTAVFKGVQFSAIKTRGFVDYEKDRQNRRKQRQQQRKKQKQNEQKQKEQRVKHLQSTFSSLLGLNKFNQQQKQKNYLQNQKQSDEQLKNLNILQQIQNDQHLLQGRYDIMDDQKYLLQKRLKYGLDQIVKPYDSTHAFPFIKAILGYKFTTNLQQSTKTKRIPDSFTDSQVYKKTFHYLVINQCIADLHQRLKKTQKQTNDKIYTQIMGLSQGSNGMAQLKLKEVGQVQEGKQKFLLKNYSMSKNRIGIITTKQKFSLKDYGIQSQSTNKSELGFTFLCMLKTPQSKQQLKDPAVIVSACIQPRQLQFIMGLISSRNCFFYDIQKLSTNIREYMSVSNVEYSFLSDHIYNPRFIDSEKRQLVHKQTRGCIDDVLATLQNQFNMTQFESIRQMALRQRGIVLLQGPPGTGKTSTLLGLLSAQYAYLKRIGDKRKIMICAPSNAAIDHITKRIRVQGLVDGKGGRIHPNVLRLGIVDTQDQDITSCSLDHICQSKIVAEKNKTLKQSHMTTIQIRQQLVVFQKQIRHLHNIIFKAQKDKNHLQVQKNQNQLKQANIQCIRLSNLLYSFRREKIISKKHFQQLEKTLLKNSQILIVTLSSSGGQKMEQVRGDIACLIVDEAAQATQPSLLIALQSGVQKVMLIGDPCQLPATTLSNDSNKTLFNRSLFERFIDAGIQPYFLNIQYRMMPMIRQYPSQKIYQQRLVDGQNILSRKIPQKLEGFAFDRSVIFIDIKNGQQRVQQSSFCNQRQANFIVKLLKKYKLLQDDLSVGVITPYQAQRKLLLKELGHLQNLINTKKTKQNEEKLKPNLLTLNSDKNSISQNEQTKHKKSHIMINTIDSFQGQQKDIILISTVRSNDRKQIGFLMDQRRINVAATRAKYVMIIIGNGDTMGSNEVWDGYLKFIESKKLYFEINSLEEEETILSKLNKKDFFNQQSIRRRFYQPNQLTFDQRKIKRNAIGKEDFQKRHKKLQVQEQLISNKKMEQIDLIQRQIQSSNMNSDASNSPELIELQDKNDQKNNKQIILSTDIKMNSDDYMSSLPINIEYPLKKAHIPIAQDLQYQAEELIRKKRKKQEQINQYEKTCQRLKKVEKQKANDQFYKFLFQ